jgi:hypothetical protein
MMGVSKSWATMHNCLRSIIRDAVKGWMMLELDTFGKAIRKYIRSETYPVAIKLIKEVDEIPLRHPSDHPSTQLETYRTPKARL